MPRPVSCSHFADSSMNGTAHHPPWPFSSISFCLSFRISHQRHPARSVNHGNPESEDQNAPPLRICWLGLARCHCPRNRWKLAAGSPIGRLCSFQTGFSSWPMLTALVDDFRVIVPFVMWVVLAGVVFCRGRCIACSPYELARQSWCSLIVEAGC